MDTKPPYINHWKRLHDGYKKEKAQQLKEKVEKILCISQSAFYRKLKAPERFLTIAEKLAIALVYDLEPSYLFPELKGELEGIRLGLL
jgi:signal transduction protein with GAF and PtsI domain